MTQVSIARLPIGLPCPLRVDERGNVRAAYLFTVLANITKDRGVQASYIFDSKGNVVGSTKQRFLPEQKPPSAADFASFFDMSESTRCSISSSTASDSL